MLLGVRQLMIGRYHCTKCAVQVLLAILGERALVSLCVTPVMMIMLTHSCVNSVVCFVMRNLELVEEKPDALRWWPCDASMLVSILSCLCSTRFTNSHFIAAPYSSYLPFLITTLPHLLLKRQSALFSSLAKQSSDAVVDTVSSYITLSYSIVKHG